MSRKFLWTSFTASIILFGAVAFGGGTRTLEASAGCYMTGSEGTICNIVQVCELTHCHYHIYRDSAPCRPAGAGPSCEPY
jgi:hypothetical protein